ncbi:hypothetical protein GOHSU_38_00260 [Gordonia hirsuta DSM 44140 = NBRC 16056]|uniref:Polyketide cyclase/dehydrase n=1 Tax=Gordonia hirsuta DSM 44140 = NBRC 16056 TaxID=1121927 RepID=L7LE93_9ACTN|nr:SRPBCC family protein [Gordonia hirsuta]GAC58387.1 hypothetical protein GOHSU_38_00260 [Gordonia hirsuta DSM 44140 = NBRC 16056]
MSASFSHIRDLDCSPATAWRLLTDPAQMNRWSTAPIRLSDNGIGERPDAVGALRTVTLPRGRARLREVVELTEYPYRFVYRVYDGGPLLLEHRGEQRLEARPRGCRLTWTVRLQVAGGLSRVLARVIGRQVGESLNALERIAAAEADVPDPGPAADRPGAPTADELAALRVPAVQALRGQTAIADRFAADDDPKVWFARVYQYVTTEMLNVQGLRNPDWLLALIPVFDRFYTENLQRYEDGDTPSAAWQRAWSLCEREDRAHPERPVIRGLLAGVSAHIDDDLPRALAQVHRDRYPDRDLREFRPDYLRLAPVFSAASDRLLAELPRSHKPWWTPIATRVHPQVRDDLLGRQGFHVGRQRLTAFASAAAAVSVR